MKRYEMIKRNEDFQEVFKAKKFKTNSLFTIYKLSYPQSYPQFGIAIKKSFGSAVDRNRIKRQIRNIIDNNKMLFQKQYRYIIMVKNACNNKTFEELNKNLTSLIKEI